MLSTGKLVKDVGLEFRRQAQAADRNLGVLRSPDEMRSPGERVRPKEGVWHPSIETDRKWPKGEENSQTSECSRRQGEKVFKEA